MRFASKFVSRTILLPLPRSSRFPFAKACALQAKTSDPGALGSEHKTNKRNTPAEHKSTHAAHMPQASRSFALQNLHNYQKARKTRQYSHNEIQIVDQNCAEKPPNRHQAITHTTFPQRIRQDTSQKHTCLYRLAEALSPSSSMWQAREDAASSLILLCFC